MSNNILRPLFPNHFKRESSPASPEKENLGAQIMAIINGTQEESDEALQAVMGKFKSIPGYNVPRRVSKSTQLVLKSVPKSEE